MADSMPPSAPAKPPPPPNAAEALARIQPEIAALPADKLAVLNIDLPRAVSIALGALPNLLPMRPAIVKSLPDHDISLLDKLEDYALAAWFSHLLTLPQADADNPVKSLLDEAAPLRANLLGDAEALARRELLNKEAVASIRAGQGNIDLANDLVALSALFTVSWASIQHKTAATEGEVERAGQLGPLLLSALGVREHGAPAGPAEPLDRRRRAFTLFTHAYDETRRAVCYLRWHEGDADQIAPSLYKGRGGRGSSTSTKQDATGSEQDATKEEATKGTGQEAPAADATSAGEAPQGG